MNIAGRHPHQGFDLLGPFQQALVDGLVGGHLAGHDLVLGGALVKVDGQVLLLGHAALQPFQPLVGGLVLVADGHEDVFLFIANALGHTLHLDLQGLDRRVFIVEGGAKFLVFRIQLGVLVFQPRDAFVGQHAAQIRGPRCHGLLVDGLLVDEIRFRL